MNTTGRKLLAAGTLVVGLLLLIFSLVMDFSGSKSSVRGYMLLGGIVLTILGGAIFLVNLV